MPLIYPNSNAALNDLMHYASIKESGEQVFQIIKDYPNIINQDYRGYTALYYALCNHRNDIAMLLINNNADLRKVIKLSELEPHIFRDLLFEIKIFLKSQITLDNIKLYNKEGKEQLKQAIEALTVGKIFDHEEAKDLIKIASFASVEEIESNEQEAYIYFNSLVTQTWIEEDLQKTSDYYSDRELEVVGSLE